MTGDRLMAKVALGGAILVILLLAYGCGTTPTCADNPRNMSCFTADELQKELNQ